MLSLPLLSKRRLLLVSACAGTPHSCGMQVEATLETALDSHDRQALAFSGPKIGESAVEAVEHSLSRQLYALEKKQNTRIDDAYAAAIIFPIDSGPLLCA